MEQQLTSPGTVTSWRPLLSEAKPRTSLDAVSETPGLPLIRKLWLDWNAEGSEGSGCLAGDFRITGDPEHGFDFEFLDLETGAYRACLHSAELAMCFTAFLCDRFAAHR